MRIAYLTHQYFPRHVGGTEVYTRGLARRAKTAGHEVIVVTAHDPISRDKALRGVRLSEFEGIPLAEIHYSLGTAPDPARYEHENPYAASKAGKVLRQFKPDIVHATHAMKLSGACLETCDALGAPFILTLCDFWFICPRHTLMKSGGELCGGPTDSAACSRCLHDTHGFPETEALKRVALRRPLYLREKALKARRIFALSDFQKRMYVQNGFPEERIEKLGHGLEVTGLKPGKKERSSIPRILFIGSLVEHKGLHVLLEALTLLEELPIECRIYGNANPRDAYADRIQKMAAADDRVRFMGNFPPEEMGSVLSGAAALALPSQWYENDPLVVKAALYAGVPVLCSDLGSLSEMVRHGDQGFLIPPNDAAAWARGIKKVLEDERMKNLPGEKLKTMDEHAAEIFSIYHEELQKHHAGAI